MSAKIIDLARLRNLIWTSRMWRGMQICRAVFFLMLGLMPRNLSRSLPAYTELARIVRASGIVVISGIIDVQGKVGNLQIINPMGLGLDESAVYKISKWQFEPAQLNGQPVAFQAFFETSFRLY